MKLYSAFNAHNIKRLAKTFNSRPTMNELFNAYQLRLFNDIYVSHTACPVLPSELNLPINTNGLYNFDEYDLVDLKIIKAVDKLSEYEIWEVNNDFINYLKKLGWKFTTIYIDDDSLVAHVDWSED